VDRESLLVLGNLSVNAIEVSMSIKCSAFPISLSGSVYSNDYGRYQDYQWKVNTADYGSLWVRLQPQLTVWVDEIIKTNETSARTRLVFAAINGTSDGGYTNIPPANSKMHKMEYDRVSTLACDVNVNLFDSQLCTWNDSSRCDTNVTLSELAHFVTPHKRGMWAIAAWLGAVVETYGVSVWGAQPLFGAGPTINVLNTTWSLPVPWTSTEAGTGTSTHWTQGNLTRFIEIGSSAFAMSLAASWTNGTQVLESSLPLKRVDWKRSLILLLPLGLALVCVPVLMLLTFIMHKGANVTTVRLGTTAEVIASTQTADMKAMVDEAKMTSSTEKYLSKHRVRYGIVPEGYAGLGRKENVTNLARGTRRYPGLK